AKIVLSQREPDTQHRARRHAEGNIAGWNVAAFFFSSRRRHTRFSRDWSSDVCSSDLGGLFGVQNPQQGGGGFSFGGVSTFGAGRSEERRVGKECRVRGSQWREKKG